MYKISWRRTNFICSFLHGFSRPYVMESKARSGFRILVVRGISDSLSLFRIPKPRIPDSTRKKSPISKSGFPYIVCFHSRGQHLCKFIGTKRGIASTGFVWGTNMAAVSLSWDSNMADVTSCGKTVYGAISLISYLAFPNRYYTGASSH